MDILSGVSMDRDGERLQGSGRPQSSNLDAHEIVGQSAAFHRVLRQVKQVAPTSATVLVQGETGVGKDVIARALHQWSARRECAFIKVLCAALPDTLLESELFGHEHGAFTGAVECQVGRFELADGGTLFLDDICELVLPMQTKLLRVLEDGEFERLGSSQTRRVDVRVIATANQDLTQLVRAGLFRADLYYRLNVFPIYMPPLRERVEDIPVLARAFMERFGQRHGKTIRTLSSATVEHLQGYAWPGNVRELGNVIERSVICTVGDTLEVADVFDESCQPEPCLRLDEVERRHILKVLAQCNGRIRGKNGAAEQIGLIPTTLESKMRKLGIVRSDSMQRDGVGHSP